MPGIFTLFGGYKTPTYPQFPFSPTTTTMPLKGKTKTIKDEENKEDVHPNVGVPLPVMPLNATGLPLTCISLEGARNMVYIGPFEWKVLPVDSPPCDQVVEEEEEEEAWSDTQKEDMVVGRRGSCV